MESVFSHLPDLLRMSWQASILIALVLAAQWLCGPRLKPRWRYLLWMLVLLRLALPWSIPYPSGIKGSSRFPVPEVSQPVTETHLPAIGAPVREMQEFARAVSSAHTSSLAWAWLAGIVCIFGLTALNQYKFHVRVTRESPLIHEPSLRLLEECKATMGVRTPVTLVESDAVESPTLFGFVRPRLLLPDGFISNFTPEELRHVFLHELAHIKRCDILAGWVVLGVQAIHWFNPFVWLAFHRMRADRELACDALALSCAQNGENESYGLTIIKLLERFGRPSLRPGLAGILEDKQQMKERISMIAKFRKTERGLALAAFVLAGVTLATLIISCRRSAETPPAAKPSAPSAPQTVQAVNSEDQGPPQIIATSPTVGATEVDPDITEITVTFDREMGQGFSWTGGGADFPFTTGKPHWQDKRTCILPVRLQPGHYYRVGVNSPSYHGFQSTKGVPAGPSAIYFTTRGAGRELQDKTAVPQIVGLDPRNGTMDVDPKLSEIRVTFSVPMGDGFSWTGGGPDFPKGPPGSHPYWTPDHKTCVLPVQLEAGKSYQFGLNSLSFRGFQSASGVPLVPVRVTFTTRSE